MSQTQNHGQQGNAQNTLPASASFGRSVPPQSQVGFVATANGIEDSEGNSIELNAIHRKLSESGFLQEIQNLFTRVFAHEREFTIQSIASIINEAHQMAGQSQQLPQQQADQDAALFDELYAMNASIFSKHFRGITAAIIDDIAANHIAAKPDAHAFTFNTTGSVQTHQPLNSNSTHSQHKQQPSITSTIANEVNQRLRNSSNGEGQQAHSHSRPASAHVQQQQQSPERFRRSAQKSSANGARDSHHSSTNQQQQQLNGHLSQSQQSFKKRYYQETLVRHASSYSHCVGAGLSASMLGLTQSMLGNSCTSNEFNSSLKRSQPLSGSQNLLQSNQSSLLSPSQQCKAVYLPYSEFSYTKGGKFPKAERKLHEVSDTPGVGKYNIKKSASISVPFGKQEKKTIFEPQRPQDPQPQMYYPSHHYTSKQFAGH